MSLSSVESWVVTTRLVVLSELEDSVLLARTEHGWDLPTVTTQGHWHAEVAPVIASAREELDVTPTAVRCLRAERDGARASVLWLMQASESAALARGDTRWLPIDEFRTQYAAEAALAARAMRAYGDGVDREPWLRPGWRHAPLAWISEQLSLRGFQIVSEPEQVRHWSITSIWRISTNGGDAWFKAVPPMFAHEGKLIELIAPSMPEHLPRVIATDPARGWTLMHALPSATLRDRPQGRRHTIGAEHDESLRVLARLQQAWIGRENELFAVGCADRRLSILDGAVEEILAREDVRARLDAAETQRLRAFARDVPNRVEALHTCGVPETLTHGDFHAGNVAIGDGELVIFDWTDGCVSHPFFDLATFLPADPVERAALLQVYLEAWSAALPEADVARAWEIAEPLACLHHAVSYARILDAVDPALRWEFDSDVMFWVRWLREIS